MNPTTAIANLIAAGLFEKDIAAAVGASQISINRYRRGTRTPDWALGEALIALAAKVEKNPKIIPSLRHHEEPAT